MAAGGMVCGWETCGAILHPMQSKRFVRCIKCCHMNCVRCRAVHEGVNCATYQAGREPEYSPPRSFSAGDSSPKAGSFSPGTSKNCGGSASQRGPSSPPKPSRPSYGDAGWSPRSTYAPSASASTLKATSPRPAPQQTAADGAKKRVLCASEGCGYEVLVDANATELPCYKCRHTTCLLCNAAHGNLTCEQYRRQKHADEEAETEVHCAKPGCDFFAFVGVSLQQMTCGRCGEITCIKCQAVHEFKTCEEYEKERRRSKGAQAAPERDRDGAVAAQAQPNERPRPVAERKPAERPPATAVTAAKAPMDREASRFQERLVSQAPAEMRPKSEVSPSRAQPVFNAPRATNQAAAQSDAFTVECCSCMVEAPFEELVEVAPCAHFLCKACVRMSGVSSLTYVVHCPVKPDGGDRCHSQIQESALQSAMNQQEYNRHKELISLPVVRCPVEGCGGKFSVRPGMESLECASCQTEYCVACSANHPGRTCRQFIDSVINGGADQLQDEVLQFETTRDAASTPSSEAEQECDACFANVPDEEIANIEGCGHFLCRNCIRGAMLSDATERIRCPVGQDDGTSCQHYIQEAALQTSTLSVRSTTDEETAASALPHASMPVECSLCLAETPYEEIVDLLWCGHFLCRDCAHRTAVNSTTYLIHCPVTPEGGVPCNSYIQESVLEAVLTAQEQERRKKLAEQ